MTDTPSNNTAEEERILKWRAERAAVAETEKQARIDKAKADREDLAKRKATELKSEAMKLLPAEETIERTRQDILTASRRLKYRLMRQTFLWVILPTIAVIYYSSQLATPLYEARSVMTVSKTSSDSQDGLGSVLGSISASSNLNESYMAHEYIFSIALMDQLENEFGLIEKLSSDIVDPVQRLREYPFFRISKRDQFDHFVESDIDIQTGLMTLYVRMPNAEQASIVSYAILKYIDVQVNALSEELFVKRIKQAQSTVLEAQKELEKKQAELTRLQIESGEANPKARIEGVFSTIGQLETELQQLRSEIDLAIVSGQAGNDKTQRLQKLEQSFLDRIDAQRNFLVKDGTNGERPLNTVLLEYELASLQVSIGEQILTASIGSLADAREKAVLGRSQFQIVVPPSTAENPKYPNTPTNALIALITMIGLLSTFKLLRPGS